MRKTLAAWMMFVLASASPTQPRTMSDEPIERIAFGSCYKTDRDDTVWTTIQARQPDALILLGDNVYADTRDEAELRAAWQALADTGSFGALREKTTLLATWDDHDYGENDAGREFPLRVESQRAFLDFLGEPADSARRAREGVYESYVFGPEGRRVQVILLDTRYHRSPLVKREQRGDYADGRHGWYLQDTSASATMLGDAQWAWLEGVLREPADLRIIASSIQVVAEDHHWERWDQFPRERTRLLRLIETTDATGVVFITGDRHKAEISLLDVARMDDEERVDAGHPMYDITASSMNAPLGGFSNEINRHRLGRVYDGPNFGEILIDWDATPSPRVTMQIVDSLTGRVVVRHGVDLADLRR
jgi:alkaline phosphatase D